MRLLTWIVFIVAALLVPCVGSPAKAQVAGDAAAGADVFKQQCAMCHNVGPGAQNSVGPVLNGIIGRKAGSYPDFGYSPQNKNFAVTWDVATLTRYLKSPKSYIVGTKMFFDGLSSPKDVADVIAYLTQFDINGNKKL
jgi:cytochrome c